MMTLDWKQAVREAITRYCDRHSTTQVTRQGLISEELKNVISDTQSVGATPHQTLSRVLQELRDAGEIYFSSDGTYVLNSLEIPLLDEDFADDIIDNALRNEKLRIDEISVFDEVRASRQRRGVSRLREMTLSNYNCTCGLCDIPDKNLLVTSHVARWADVPEARGKLSNVLCLCSFHDRLFEYGYISLSDDLALINKPNILSSSIKKWLSYSEEKLKPSRIPPKAEFLRMHRNRIGAENWP
jgi:hypothetical protein